MSNDLNSAVLREFGRCHTCWVGRILDDNQQLGGQLENTLRSLL